MYRYTKQTPSATGQTYGSIVRDGDLPPNAIKKLLAKGILVREVTPPLSEIPNFEDRAKQLAKAGVITVTDLVETDVKTTAKKIRKSQSTIRRWQMDAIQWLSPEPEVKKSR